MKIKPSKEIIIEILNKINNSVKDKPVAFYVKLVGKETSKTYKHIKYLIEIGYLEYATIRWGNCKHTRFKKLCKSINLTERGKKYIKRNQIKIPKKTKLFEENLFE
jgi:hypothetical protein